MIEQLQELAAQLEARSRNATDEANRIHCLSSSQAFALGQAAGYAESAIAVRALIEEHQRE